MVLGEGLLRLLRALAGERGCLLVLEDLHWADPESLAVLEYLADNVAGERIVCLGTLRSEESGAGRRVHRDAGRPSRGARRRAGAGSTTRRPCELARACLGDARAARAVEACSSRVRRRPAVPGRGAARRPGRCGVLVERDGRWSTTGPARRAGAGDVRRRRRPAPGRAAAPRPAACCTPPRCSAGASTGRCCRGHRAGRRRGGRRAAPGGGRAAGDRRRRDGFRFRHALTRDAVLADLLPPERAALAARALGAVHQAHPELSGRLVRAGRRARRSGRRPAAGGRAAAARPPAAAMTAGALATAEATLQRAGGWSPTTRCWSLPIDDALTDVLALAGQVDRAFELGDRLLARLDLASRLPSGGAELHLRLARAGVAAGRWPVAAEHLARPARGRPGRSAGRLDGEPRRARRPGRPGAGSAGRGRAPRWRRPRWRRPSAPVCRPSPARRWRWPVGSPGSATWRRPRRRSPASWPSATAHGLELWRLRALHELGHGRPAAHRERRTAAAGPRAGRRGRRAGPGRHAGPADRRRVDQAVPVRARVWRRPGSVEASRRLRLATLPMALVHQAAAHAQRGRRRGDGGLPGRGAGAGARRPRRARLRLGSLPGRAGAAGRGPSRALAEMSAGAAAAPARRRPTVAPPFLGLRVLLLAVGRRRRAHAAAAERSARRVPPGTGSSPACSATPTRSCSAGPAGATRRPPAFAGADVGLGPLVAWYRQYARRVVAEAALADGWGDAGGLAAGGRRLLRRPWRAASRGGLPRAAASGRRAGAPRRPRRSCRAGESAGAGRDQPRGRRAGAGRRGPDQPGARRAPAPVAAHGREARGQPARQDRLPPARPAGWVFGAGCLGSRAPRPGRPPEAGPGGTRRRRASCP